MILHIAGNSYFATPIPPHEEGTAAVRLLKDDGRVYDLILTHSGLLSCDCPDYVCRKLGTPDTCKHGKACVDAGLIPAPDPIPNSTGSRAGTPI